MVYLLYQYIVPTHPFSPILSTRHVINKDSIPNPKEKYGKRNTDCFILFLQYPPLSITYTPPN